MTKERTAEEKEWMELIKQAKELGFTIEQIREFLRRGQGHEEN